jgi:hypothetical protein
VHLSLAIMVTAITGGIDREHGQLAAIVVTAATIEWWRPHRPDGNWQPLSWR